MLIRIRQPNGKTTERRMSALEACTQTRHHPVEVLSAHPDEIAVFGQPYKLQRRRKVRTSASALFRGGC